MEHQSVTKSVESKPDIAQTSGRQKLDVPQSLQQLQTAFGNRGLGSIIQAKLKVSSPTDEYEHEADRVADQIMRMPDNSAAPSHVSGCCSTTVVQRKCAECEEEEEKNAPPVQRKVDDESDEELDVHRSAESGNHSGPMSAPLLGSFSSGGESLPLSVRNFFEPRFGQDFSHVRVHAGTQAAESARGINALAYTSGRNIVFGTGRFAPDTTSGKRLLAHELTHVVQQRQGLAGGIQRAVAYPVTGIEPDAASYPNQIFFEYGSVFVPALEAGKIPALATPASRALDLNGFASEEGSLASRTTVTNARIASVSTALRGARHTGTHHTHPHPAAGEGDIHYRRKRTVEVVPTGSASSVGGCDVTPANPTPMVRPCGGALAAAHAIAGPWMVRALSELAGPTAAATSHVSTLFPGSTPATLHTRLTSLSGQIAQVITPGHHLCHTTCDPVCDRSANNGGAGPAAIMTLCPGFLDNTNVTENAETLVHESLHGTPGVTAIDNAYSGSREIDFLSSAASATNTDSYVLLVLRLQVGGAPAGTLSPPADARGTGLTPPQFATARRALSWLEQWLLAADWDLQQLYGGVQRNVGRAGGWNPADAYHAETLHRIGWLFGLTDPVVPGYTNSPTRDDQIAVAGLWHRYLKMRETVWTTNIRIEKAVPPATEEWSSGPGTTVTIDDTFFAVGITPMDQVLKLCRLLAAKTPGVAAAQVANYATAANQIRWHFSSGRVGPP